MENNLETYFNINEYFILDSISTTNKIISTNTNNSENNINCYTSKEKEIVPSEINSYKNLLNISDKIFGPLILKIQDKKISFSERVKKKIIDILNCLNIENKINFKNLRKLIFDGIPDEFPGVRSILWKLMLNYLPSSVKEWEEYLLERRLDYENIKMDYIIINKDYNEDYVFNEIVKDVKRTRTHMHFFTLPSKSNPKETNAEILTRILFIFAKLHPDLSYVQGMNEISATIFYCFSSDSNPFFNTSIEADTLYCFENLMLEIKEIFLIEKDDTESGIHFRIDKINYLLEFYDKDLFEHFTKEKIELHYFMFRWYTLLFTQEFSMPDTLRLWDSVVVQNDKFEFVSYLCLGMILLHKNILINKDFSNIMYVMQNLNLLDINIESLIKCALKIKNKSLNLLHSF